MASLLDPHSEVTATHALQGLRLGDPARGLVAGARNPRELVAGLLAEGLVKDAVKVVLRVLPRAYAIAWTCDCIAGDGDDAWSTETEAVCLSTAQAWLRQGTEVLRAASAEYAETAGYESPCAWLAAAVGWTGGSLAPRGYEVVAPGPWLTSEACYAALLQQAARKPGEIAARLAGWTRSACVQFGGVAPGDTHREDACPSPPA